MPILLALPDWFGIREAVDRYLKEIDHLPTFLVGDAEQAIGFVCIKQHNIYSAEVYVMGVRPEAHRHGLGRSLLVCAQMWLQEQGVEYLQVKTLGPSHSDSGYTHTRAFYLAMGFRPLEEFRQIWDEQNPCLVMIKRL